MVRSFGLRRDGRAVEQTRRNASRVTGRGRRYLVIAGFMAVFMSTIATQLNWGASYLVADFYRRFIKRDGDEKHYVNMSRVATVILVIASALVSVLLADIRSGWQAVLEVGAGTGAVYLLRWYWWRINAWSEISAMAI